MRVQVQAPKKYFLAENGANMWKVSSAIFPYTVFVHVVMSLVPVISYRLEPRASCIFLVVIANFTKIVCRLHWSVSTAQKSLGEG